MTLVEQIEKEFNLKKDKSKNIIKLIDEGNTIPFIARYRKEMTGNLDDQVLREILDRILYIRNLNDKKEQVKNLIEEQGLLTTELKQKIDSSETLAEVEDLYRPFRPKRKTKATIAKEKGLEPLAKLILKQEINENLEEYFKEYINQEKELLTIEDVSCGVKDIIAEIISENANYRKFIKKIIFQKGHIVSKKLKDEKSIYEIYYDYVEPIKKIANHRILAINRGEKEKFLNVKIEEPIEEIINFIEKDLNKNNKFTSKFISETIKDSYKRLIYPSVEREVRNMLTETAEEGAIKVFSKNLKQLLLQQPFINKVVLAIDPGFRTGCKLAVINKIGNVIDTGVIYPTKPNDKIEEANYKVKDLIKKYNVDIIAIGNGTASRETEIFISNLIKEIDREVKYIIVNEAGASIYSASKVGAAEFPNYDVSIRGAISIGRRLQDPLAELVKIEPRSIGVGQYQHDMNQKRLNEVLTGVVENCVNSVGVNLNTASSSLLYYISGISENVAKNIVKFREENGKFTNRKQLLEVKKLGAKTFEQCAGFLRILDGDEPLDNTSVHPEAYSIVKKLLKKLNMSVNEFKNTNILNSVNYKLEDLANELGVGLFTLEDIIKELEKPGRDLRFEMPPPILKKDVLTIEDLKQGQILKGTVRNVTDFGAFVDIGVHQDGLIHISEMSQNFIKSPLDILSIGDILEVKVLNIELEKNKISLSMKI